MFRNLSLSKGNKSSKSRKSIFSHKSFLKNPGVESTVKRMVGFYKPNMIKIEKPKRVRNLNDENEKQIGILYKEK